MRVSIDRENKLVNLEIDKCNCHESKVENVVWTFDEWINFKNKVDAKIAKSHRF